MDDDHGVKDSGVRHRGVKPKRLQPGDRVHLVSPASTPTEEAVAATTRRLVELGLDVVLGAHALDRVGYLAGTDEDRLDDINRALRDPDAAAVIATRGGKGAYRIAGRLDFAAAAAHPKLMIGFSEITILQLALLTRTGLASIHGAAWGDEDAPESAASFQRAAFTDDPIVVRADAAISTAPLTTSGRAGGLLIGGNQDMIATAHDWCLPDLDGAIVLLEDIDKRLGHLDRQLTRLIEVGALDRVAGVAVGQYEGCGPDASTEGDWTTNDVLADRLGTLGVPILGGLPIGHGDAPLAVPIGTRATLDADAGTLTVASATT